MPSASLRSCIEPGCTNRQDGTRCPVHAARRQRAIHRTRGSRQARGYDADWERVRELVLERDGHACQVRGRGCRGTATTVDHVVPLARGGARLDPANLRAACATCNSRLGGAVRRHRGGGVKSLGLPTPQDRSAGSVVSRPGFADLGFRRAASGMSEGTATSSRAVRRRG